MKNFKRKSLTIDKVLPSIHITELVLVMIRKRI
ncbi:hypothetical protein CR513_39778 [Mucuna pruriens]|uniref:Uncharacterized protein n=1 Tax=Mucuna pruriens TaxID=157652 RepID=A0A371FN42_MUCPR|nr:hypothetical protein CR513_39778 [Mucuna pruriens]